jgi:hypothetical protein
MPLAARVLLVPESKSPAPGRVDYPGVLLSMARLVLLVYGVIRGGDIGSWLNKDVLGPIVAGLAVLAVFCWHESRTEYPSLDVRLFRDPRLSSAAVAIGLNFFAMTGVYFFMSFYLPVGAVDGGTAVQHMPQSAVQRVRAVLGED